MLPSSIFRWAEGFEAVRSEPPRMPTIDAKYWIDRLDLQPHPEGGYFRETYRADRRVDVDGLDRSASTAIYFLLERGEFSALHRIKSDEVWHFYDGSPLLISAILTDGTPSTWRLGLGDDAVPQCVVPAGAWFGAELVDGGDFALVGCTVAPGFEFEDFEMGDRQDLLVSHPEHPDIIHRLTR